ncbi:MAG: bifunctional adenosylcobinamide kinase/adenosylcobinamide-phosphate guanylyltransferase [Propionivibrio sp.]|nr:bifunctional adenosylcobinamide kinase/adenosylcobinamide-phosphate guanylyltransferase [Propionivibrio sp.]
MRELIIGGARSGKSTYARIVQGKWPARYLRAIPQFRDSEMEQRIAHHRARRPATWGWVESPSNWQELAAACGAREVCLLVDCLILWAVEPAFAGAAARQAEAGQPIDCPLFRRSVLGSTPCRNCRCHTSSGSKSVGVWCRWAAVSRPC